MFASLLVVIFLILSSQKFLARKQELSQEKGIQAANL